MKPKTALVTGANRGIGLEIATELCQRGFHVFVSGRNLAAISRVVAELTSQGLLASPLLLDMANSESIAAAAAAFTLKQQTLDVLINNAGILLDEDQSILDVSRQGAERTLFTNALGPLWLVQALLPVLDRGSRVVNISSGGGQVCGELSTWSPLYCVSKTTLNALTRQLAHALDARGIVVNAMCPGWVRSDMGGNSAPRSVAQGAETAVWLACDANARLTGKFFRDKREIDW